MLNISLALIQIHIRKVLNYIFLIPVTIISILTQCKKDIIEGIKPETLYGTGFSKIPPASLPVKFTQ